jgi:hypothetical protein
MEFNSTCSTIKQDILDALKSTLLETMRVIS